MCMNQIIGHIKPNFFLSDRAKELKEQTHKHFMVIDGKRLFVTLLPISYTPTANQNRNSEDLLEYMI